MKQTLTFWEILPVGLMLFSSFFGAGNLIFPPALGQAAGDHFWSAAIGFCVTGVGMPLLGIIAMALTKSDNPNALADPVHPNFAKVIVMLGVLTIGPFFAIPRTGAVSYDVGIRPFVPEDYYTLGLAIYSLFFFIITYVLSINPSKLVDWLGKVLTPMLLLSLAVLIINVLLAPMGPMQPATGNYINIPFLSGFQDGYNTMDLLATLLFGATVINAIKLKGITDDRLLTKICVYSGLIAAFFLALIYVALAYTGATSVSILGISANGGVALADIANYYLGAAGNVVLCLMIFFACLTTSIGLTASAASYFTKVTHEQVQYQRFVVAICVFSFAVSNVGLTNIISFSIPILCALYPIIIALVLLGVTAKLFHGDRRVYRCCLFFTTIFALLDGIKAAGLQLTGLEALLNSTLPLYAEGFGWIVPSLIGTAIGLIWKVLAPEKTK
ncbi:branched-chain amino acid transport system II carrier protein [Phascolarctobacterium sp.]